MDTARRIKKPLIHQVGSAESLCRFYSHWLRTPLLSSGIAKESSGKQRFFFETLKTDSLTAGLSADRNNT